MNEREKDKLALALSILSGRVVEPDHDEYELLGYNTYLFSYYGRPDIYLVKEKAEEIILEMILGMHETTDKEE
jgi:hypothetical protein